MLENNLTSLDSVSRSRIPNLAPGECIATGTSFEVPICIKVDMLGINERPKSENADIVKLWRSESKK